MTDILWAFVALLTAAALSYLSVLFSVAAVKTGRYIQAQKITRSLSYIALAASPFTTVSTLNPASIEVIYAGLLLALAAVSYKGWSKQPVLEHIAALLLMAALSIRMVHQLDLMPDPLGMAILVMSIGMMVLAEGTYYLQRRSLSGRPVRWPF